MNIFTITLVAVFIIFLFKFAAFILLTKAFKKKVDLPSILKTFFMFEILFFGLAFLYPESGYTLINPVWKFLIYFVPFILITYGLFYAVTRVTKFIDWKKGIAFFVIMYLLVTPLIVIFDLGGRIVHPVVDWVRPNFLEDNFLEQLQFSQDRPIAMRVVAEIRESFGGISSAKIYNAFDL